MSDIIGATLTIEVQKHQIIVQKFESNEKTKSQLADEFGLGKSTITGIIKKKDEIYKAFASGNITPKAKRFRTAKNVEVGEELISWFNNARNVNIPISGPILMKKAKAIATSHGLDDFRASSGWLSGFSNGTVWEFCL